MTNDEIRERLARRVPDGWDGVTVDDGWLTIVDDLDRRLAAINPDYKIHQCKSKFGGLRYYTDADGDHRCAELIRTAEARSLHICEDCGAPGETVSVGGWLSTVCPAHRAERTARRTGWPTR